MGTDSAEIGAKAGNSPLGWVGRLAGGSTLNRSQGLYYDLVRERPGSLLFWLNRQEHLSSRYISVVRGDDGLLNFGDLVVPDWSQDMNQVVALRGRSIKSSDSKRTWADQAGWRATIKDPKKQQPSIIAGLPAPNRP